MDVSLQVTGQNGADHPALKSFVIYATVREFRNSGNLLLAASLEYCAQAIEDRGWVLREVNGSKMEIR